MRKYQYGEDGTVISTAKGVAPVSLTKGSTTVVLSAAAVGLGAGPHTGSSPGAAVPRLLATLEGGAAVCAYRADTPVVAVEDPKETVEEEGVQGEERGSIPEPPSSEPPVLSIQVNDRHRFPHISMLS